jgi:hypothetical protein
MLLPTSFARPIKPQRSNGLSGPSITPSPIASGGIRVQVSGSVPPVATSQPAATTSQQPLPPKRSLPPEIRPSPIIRRGDAKKETTKGSRAPKVSKGKEKASDSDSEKLGGCWTRDNPFQSGSRY